MIGGAIVCEEHRRGEGFQRVTTFENPALPSQASLPASTPFQVFWSAEGDTKSCYHGRTRKQNSRQRPSTHVVG